MTTVTFILLTTVLLTYGPDPSTMDLIAKRTWPDIKSIMKEPALELVENFMQSQNLATHPKFGLILIYLSFLDICK